MIKALAGLALFFCWGQIVAGSLWLKTEANLPEGFLRLSDLLETKLEGERYREIFLGQIKLGEEKKIYLSYLKKRLARYGYLTVTPALKSGTDFVLVKAVEGEALKIEADNVKVSNKVDQIVVMKEMQPRGTVLILDMLENRPMTDNNKDAFREVEEVVGYELERNLSKGSAIKPRYISRPPLLKKGDAVKVIIRGPGIEISGIAKTLEDGSLGQIISIRRHHESMQAKVLDDQTVLVEGL